MMAVQILEIINRLAQDNVLVLNLSCGHTHRFERHEFYAYGSWPRLGGLWICVDCLRTTSERDVRPEERS